MQVLEKYLGNVATGTCIKTGEVVRGIVVGIECINGNYEFEILCNATHTVYVCTINLREKKIWLH